MIPQLENTPVCSEYLETKSGQTGFGMIGI